MHARPAGIHLAGRMDSGCIRNIVSYTCRLGLVEPTWEEVNRDDTGPKVFDEFFAMDPDGEFGMVSSHLLVWQRRPPTRGTQWVVHGIIWPAHQHNMLYALKGHW